MNLVHNERVKLLAGALSTTGIGMLIAGAVVPLVGILHGTVPSGSGSPRWILALAWILVGTGLHLLAQAALGRLRDG